MTTKLKKTLIGAMALAAAGAFTTEAVAQSRAACESYARDYANDVVPTGGNVVGGAAAGAITGAIIGGIIGGGRGAGTGAAIGGGAGALGGAGHSSAQWNRAYRSAYNDCMSRRSAAPEPWSAAWYDYCSSRYRTFNPDTGYYFYKPGKRRFCR